MYKRSQEFFIIQISNLIVNRICHVYFINSEDFFCPVRGISVFKMSFIFSDTDYHLFCTLYSYVIYFVFL